MGRRSIAVTSSRSEFLPSDAESELQYERNGGCFVTTKKALLLFIIAISCFIVLALLMFYYGPSSKVKEVIADKADIENLINKSINSIRPDLLQLPQTIYPTFYKLRIQPYMDDVDPKKNFTFRGKITIGIRCTENTNQIVMNAGNIQIDPNDVVLYTNQVLIKSLSQISNITSDDNQKNQTNTNTTTSLVDTATKTTPNFDNSTEKIETVYNSTEKTNTTTTTTTTTTSRPFHVTNPLDEQNTEATRKSSDVLMTTVFPTTLKNEENKTTSTSSIETTTDKKLFSLNSTESPKPAETVTASSETKYVTSTSAKPILSKGNQVMIPILNVDNSPTLTKLTISVGKFMEVGVNYTLEIKFSGNISDNLLGLYKASYIDSQGQERWVLNTNFRPVYAREVFPCFDHPSLKTTFEISIARKQNMTALSNMPLKETEPKSEKGWVWDHFQKTPRMTTYSVSFSVGHFENILVNEKDPEFKIWAVDNLHESNFSAKMSLQSLDFLKGFYGIKYPLPKLDFVVVPDLAEDAVESWGLVAFRDQSLLVNPKSENWEIKSNILRNLVDQLSHQWFGKLVSMSDWSDFWLREAMGKFLAFEVVNKVNPQMGMLDTFVVENIPVLYADSLKTTINLHQHVESTRQLKEIFTSSVLNKGTAVLRMLNFTLSGSVFQRGIESFMKQWSFNSTSASKFWETLDKIASAEKILPENITVKMLTDSWTKQAGYPVVTVSRNFSTGKVQISQQRFIEGNGTYNDSWIIPLTYITKEHSEIKRVWMINDKEKEIEINHSKSNESWVIFNVDAGFYRVNYDDHNWKNLLNQINTNPLKIPSSYRAQILNDAFELAYKGIIKYEIPLELTKYLGSEERVFAPWEAVTASFRNIGYIFKRTMHYGKLLAYLQKLIKQPFEELTFNERASDSLATKILRKHIIETACHIRQQSCLQWAQKMFQEWVEITDPDKHNPIPYTFRKIVMCNAIKVGGEREWEFVWRRTISSTTTPADLKVMYLSLGCSRDPWIIKKYLHLSLNGSIALQDVPYVWKSITNPVGIDVGLQFIRENWQNIYNTYDEVSVGLESIINEFFSKLSTKSDLEDLTMLYKDHENKLDKISPAMLNVVERIKIRIDWAKNNLETVASWLENNAR